MVGITEFWSALFWWEIVGFHVAIDALTFHPPFTLSRCRTTGAHGGGADRLSGHDPGSVCARRTRIRIRRQQRGPAASRVAGVQTHQSDPGWQVAAGLEGSGVRGGAGSLRQLHHGERPTPHLIIVSAQLRTWWFPTTVSRCNKHDHSSSNYHVLLNSIL